MKNKAERAELVRQFQEIKIDDGVYQIRNTVNGKVYIGSMRNLKGLNRIGVTMSANLHPNKRLQQEWNEFGADAFAIEVLEILPENDNPFVDVKDELKKLEASWIAKVQPFGERGYHTERA